jgi:P-type Ca2+ transporter type 2C
MTYYTQEIRISLSSLKTDAGKGLTKDEAARRLEEYGPNRLESKKKKSFLSMFIAQFRSFMIIILLIAAVISGFVGVMEGEGLLDTFIILLILLINAFIGAFQEEKSGKLT